MAGYCTLFKKTKLFMVQIIFLPLFLKRSSLPNFFRDQFSSNASSIVSFSFTAGQQSGTTSKRTQVRSLKKSYTVSTLIPDIEIKGCIQSGRPPSEYQTEVRYLNPRLNKSSKYWTLGPVFGLWSEYQTKLFGIQTII